ncbi:MAG: hypothetical protein GY937_06855 [bacterium]|nr:hypothetical protein [bacterium]
MAVLFALSVAVQWNDPDPIFWMGIYGLALVLAAMGAAGRLPFWPNAAALGLFIVLFLVWMPSLLDSRQEAFTSFEMKTSTDEAPREAGGLLLCVVWSAVLTHRARAGRTDPKIR